MVSIGNFFVRHLFGADVLDGLRLQNEIRELREASGQQDRLLLEAAARVKKAEDLVVFYGDVAARSNEQACRLHTELMAERELSTKDHLTGVLNRRGMETAFHQEYARLLRMVRDPEHLKVVEHIGFIHVDLDKFKTANDCLGHGRGDTILATVGSLMRGLFRRPDDIVARLGGDEFVVILPETHPEETIRQAERLCAVIYNEESFVFTDQAGDPCRITASIGTTVADIRRESDRNAEAALRNYLALADRGTYRSKDAGRNAVSHVVEGSSSE